MCSDTFHQHTAQPSAVAVSAWFAAGGRGYDERR